MIKYFPDKNNASAFFKFIQIYGLIFFHETQNLFMFVAVVPQSQFSGMSS